MFAFDEEKLRELNEKINGDMKLTCPICLQKYPIGENSVFCPECRKRLKHLLYGEPEKDYKQLEDIIG